MRRLFFYVNFTTLVGNLFILITSIIPLMLLISCNKKKSSNSDTTNTVSIAFISNGGTAIDTIKVKFGNKINKPNNPTRIGYDFVNWYTDKLFTKAFDFNTAITTNITLYANWALTTTIPISPSDYQSILGKGMDVDWVKTMTGMTNYSTKNVSDFKIAGIHHVRLRISQSYPTYDNLFSTLDNVLNDCFSYNIIPIVAYQADPLNARLNIDSFVNWWALIAQRYKDKPYIMAFDLNIEPSEQINQNPTILNQAYERAVTAIRQYSPNRIIMISPRYRASPYFLSELTIPTQANGYLMAQWHFYASGPSPTPGRKEDVTQTSPVFTNLTYTYQYWQPGSTGTIYEKWLIKTAINAAVAWQSRTNIATYIGAWMPGNYNDGNNYTINQQVLFATFMTQSIQNANIPFALNSDTKFYDIINKKWFNNMQPVFNAVFN